MRRKQLARLSLQHSHFVYPPKAAASVTASNAFEQLADAPYVLCLAYLQARLALKLREVPIGWVQGLL
jgi:hypothetical protein